MLVRRGISGKNKEHQQELVKIMFVNTGEKCLLSPTETQQLTSTTPEKDECWGERFGVKEREAGSDK